VAVVASGCAGTPAPATPPAPAPAITGSHVDEDHAAAAAAIFEAMNYVAPAELGYSQTRGVVVYPACSGGEGPGERCQLAGLDHAGKDVDLGTVVAWKHYGHDDTDRDAAVAELTRGLTALDTIRMRRLDWSGTGIDVPDFGRVEWDGKAFVASRDGKTVRVPAEWANGGGPVAVYAAPAAPVAVAQLRVNPASGGTEGYVVFISLVVVPRP